MDTTLFRKSFKNDILICQVYVDDIIFGTANVFLGREFAKSMQVEFEMSMMEELKLFMGIQINQSTEGTCIHQTKYVKELLKKFQLS